MPELIIRIRQYSQQFLSRANIPCQHYLYTFEAIRDESERLFQNYLLDKTETLYESPKLTRCDGMIIDFIAAKLNDMGYYVSIYSTDCQNRCFGFNANEWDVVRETTLKFLPFLLNENPAPLASYAMRTVGELNELRRENAALKEGWVKLKELIETFKK